MRNSIYETVTNRIIHSLEAGTPPWIRPWNVAGCAGGVMPYNVTSRREYSGVNILLLWLRSDDMAFGQIGWLTFKQALDAGGNVRKGEKGCKVVYMGTHTRVLKDPEDDPETYQFLKAATVFNIEQCENLPDKFYAKPDPLPETERNNTAERFIKNTGAIIKHGNKSCYNPRDDFITLPVPQAFKVLGSYYSSAFHELGHWSGHESRLNRDLKSRFGDRAYAAEELIAEMTSAFLCGQMGFEAELQHPSYLQNWLSCLKADSRAIFTAASKASQAARFLNERAYSKKAA